MWQMLTGDGLRRPRHTLIFLLLLVGARLVASIWFAVHIPLWEHPDERNHYEYARFIVREGRLPGASDLPDWPPELLIFSQLNQPPLYYLLIAPAVALFEPEDTPIYANPHALCDLPRTHTFIHTTAERFPFEGAARAAWVGRLLTMLLGIGATIAVWLAARIMWPDRPAAAPFAALIFAIHPAAVELSTWINNDAPLILFGALLLIPLSRIYRGLDRWWDWLLLVGTALACTLTKLNGLAAWPVVLLMMAYRIAGKDRRRLLIGFAGLGALVLGGFIAWNLVRCGELICRMHRYTLTFDSWESLLATFTDEAFGEAISHLVETSLPFLNLTLTPPGWMVALALLVPGVGLLGALLAGIEDRRTRGRFWLLVLLILSALALALLRVWWLLVGYMPLRYFALVLPVLTLLVAVGWLWLAHRVASRLVILPAGILGLLLMLTPLLLFRPLQMEPPRYEQQPAEAVTVENYTFDKGVQIGGYAVVEYCLRLYCST
jgi:hypothetical protein